jgi:hypothetical protein
LPDNFYYCWGQDSSKAILIAATGQLAENRVYQYPLINISCKDERLSILYCIDVRQTAIREEAYHYFENLRLNVEQTGSIFAPIPGEIRGNIRCITYPDRPVIGYVEVATTTRKDLYVPENGSYYEPVEWEESKCYRAAYIFILRYYLSLRLICWQIELVTTAATKPNPRKTALLPGRRSITECVWIYQIKNIGSQL